MIRRLRIQALKAHVEASREFSLALASQFEIAPTSLEKTRIARRYDQALKQTHALQLLLEMLEKQGSEA